LNPIEWCDSRLYPGDMLIRKADGTRLVKCGEQWDCHKTDEHTYFNLKTGLLVHISNYVLVTMSLADFLNSFEIKYA